MMVLLFEERYNLETVVKNLIFLLASCQVHCDIEAMSTSGIRLSTIPSVDCR